MALKGDAYPGLSRWALSVFMHILLRDGLRRPETHRGRKRTKVEKESVLLADSGTEVESFVDPRKKGRS